MTKEEDMTIRKAARHICAAQAFKSDNKDAARYLSGDWDNTVWMRLVEQGIRKGFVYGMEIMTEYGRIHTDGSRSGGQPAQGYGVVTAANYISPIGGAGVVTHGVVGVAAQSDALREALEAAPLIGRTESIYDFMERQNAWLKGPYRAAMQEQS